MFPPCWTLYSGINPAYMCLPVRRRPIGPSFRWLRAVSLTSVRFGPPGKLVKPRCWAHPDGGWLIWSGQGLVISTSNSLPADACAMVSLHCETYSSPFRHAVMDGSLGH